eukprot:2864473-Rhodomonas_salina.1
MPWASAVWQRCVLAEMAAPDLWKRKLLSRRACPSLHSPLTCLLPRSFLPCQLQLRMYQVQLILKLVGVRTAAGL